jgi:hypothetical protein
MAGRVLIKAVRNLTDVQDGDEAWVERSEYVDGLVRGGYFVIVDEESAAPRKSVTAKKVDGVSDQVEPE